MAFRFNHQIFTMFSNILNVGMLLGFTIKVNTRFYTKGTVSSVVVKLSSSDLEDNAIEAFQKFLYVPW